MKPKDHIMFDLETLGLRPRSPVITIGAVYFTSQLVYPGGKCLSLDLTEQMRHGCLPDPGTISWWLAQDQAAHESLIGAMADPLGLRVALSILSGWIKQFDDVQVWGNGSNFDIAKIDGLYDLIGEDVPWHYRSPRCFRTEMARHGVEDDWVMPTVKHDAVADAQAQAETLINMWKRTGQC